MVSARYVTLVKTYVRVGFTFSAAVSERKFKTNEIIVSKEHGNIAGIPDCLKYKKENNNNKKTYNTIRKASRSVQD